MRSGRWTGEPGFPKEAGGWLFCARLSHGLAAVVILLFVMPRPVLDAQ